MRLQECHPIVVTARLAPCRDFHVRWFGVRVVLEASWFGLEFRVEDAAAEYEPSRDGGAPLTLTLRDEPFGQRRFGLFDPAGTWIDVVEQIEPQPDWWTPYLPAASGS